MMHDPNCLFCKIIAGQIPSKKVYEDEHIFAFHDIAPWAPVHFLMVPKLHIASMAQLAPEHAALMGHLMTLAPRLALEQGCSPYPDGGYRIVTNTGSEAGQVVQSPCGSANPYLVGRCTCGALPTYPFKLSACV